MLSYLKWWGCHGEAERFTARGIALNSALGVGWYLKALVDAAFVLAYGEADGKEFETFLAHWHVSVITMTIDEVDVSVCYSSDEWVEPLRLAALAGEAPLILPPCKLLTGYGSPVWS